jgi:hypothetical protein
MASGMLVVPEEKELINLLLDGMKYPIPTPTAIAANIHKVKNRSRKLSFFLPNAGAQFVADIQHFIFEKT